MNKTVHVNVPLTNLSIGYDNEGLHIAEKIVGKRINVTRDSDLYVVYDSNFRRPDDFRASGTEAKRASFDATTATYNCQDYALKDVITPRQMRNTDKPIMLEADTTKNLTMKVLDNMEVRLAEILFTTASWTNNTSLAATWADATADVADPISAIDTAAINVIKGSGMTPNLCVIGRDVLTHCKINGALRDRMKYTSRDVLTPDILAALFEVPQLIVGQHLDDTTNEATAASVGFTWEDNVWIGYRDPNPGLRSRTAIAMVSVGGRKVKTWNEESLEDSKVIEVSDNYQFIQPLTSAGYLIKDTNAGA